MGCLIRTYVEVVYMDYTDSYLCSKVKAKVGKYIEALKSDFGGCSKLKNNVPQ